MRLSRGEEEVEAARRGEKRRGEDDIEDKDTSDRGIPELGNNVDRSINYVKPGTGCQSASNPGVLQR